jgi:hypothetical protein
VPSKSEANVLCPCLMLIHFGPPQTGQHTVSYVRGQAPSRPPSSPVGRALLEEPVAQDGGIVTGALVISLPVESLQKAEGRPLQSR